MELLKIKFANKTHVDTSDTSTAFQRNSLRDELVVNSMNVSFQDVLTFPKIRSLFLNLNPGNFIENHTLDLWKNALCFLAHSIDFSPLRFLSMRSDQEDQENIAHYFFSLISFEFLDSLEIYLVNPKGGNWSLSAPKFINLRSLSLTIESSDNSNLFVVHLPNLRYFYTTCVDLDVELPRLTTLILESSIFSGISPFSQSLSKWNQCRFIKMITYSDVGDRDTLTLALTSFWDLFRSCKDTLEYFWLEYDSYDVSGTFHPHHCGYYIPKLILNARLSHLRHLWLQVFGERRFDQIRDTFLTKLQDSNCLPALTHLSLQFTCHIEIEDVELWQRDKDRILSIDILNDLNEIDIMGTTLSNFRISFNAVVLQQLFPLLQRRGVQLFHYVEFDLTCTNLEESIEFECGSGDPNFEVFLRNFSTHQPITRFSTFGL